MNWQGSLPWAVDSTEIPPRVKAAGSAGLKERIFILYMIFLLDLFIRIATACG